LLLSSQLQPNRNAPSNKKTIINVPLLNL